MSGYDSGPWDEEPSDLLLQGFTTADLMRLQNATFSEFRSRPPRASEDDARPLFKVGSLAFCPVQQLLRRSGVPPSLVQSEEEKAKLQAKFRRGNRVEEEVLRAVELAGLLIQKQIPLYDPELECRGYADMVWGGAFRPDIPYWVRDPAFRWTIGEYQQRAQEAAGGSVPITLSEVKSTATYSLERQLREGPAPWYRAQLAAYALIVRRHPEYLDAPEVERFEFVVTAEGSQPACFRLEESDVDAIEDRLGMLRAAWHGESPWPACECGLTPGMAWSGPGNCDYTNPEDPTTCCGTSMLDRLEQSVAATEGAT